MMKKMTIVKINGSEVATMVKLATIAMTFGIGFSYIPTTKRNIGDADTICFYAPKAQILLTINEMADFSTISKEILKRTYSCIETNAEEVNGEISLSYSQTINLL